jgi:hypothetical protein
MELPNVDAITKLNIPSLSRAGRNEAAHKELSARNRYQSVVGSPRTSSIRKAEAAHQGNSKVTEFFEANTFGEQQTSDVPRREMCSSPRLHPQRATQALQDYRHERMATFEDLHRSIPKLSLVDLEGICSDGARQLTTGRTPRALDEFLEEDEAAANGNIETPRVGSDDDDDEAVHSRRGGTALKDHKVDSPSKLTKVPKPPHGAPENGPSACFLSPTRWREVVSQNPPVGHYRPKFFAVEHRPLQGNILPLGSTTPREKRVIGPGHAAGSPRGVDLGSSPASQAGSGVVLPPIPGDHQPGRSPALGDDIQSPTRRGGPPGPTFESTSAFKSMTKRPQVHSSNPDPGAYWPLNDLAIKSPPKGQIRFDRMPGRDYEVATSPRSCAPDAVYQLPSTLKVSSPVKMSKQIPRPQPGVIDLTTEAPLRVSDVNPVYSTDVSVALKFPRSPQYSFEKLSPRDGGASTKKNAPHGVSVESVEGDLTEPLRPHLPVLAFERLTARKEEKPTINDLTYNVDDSLTVYRTPHAILREDGAGHLPLWEKRITDNCSYNPQLNSSRPKILREIDFSKDVPRPEHRVRMADLDYNPQHVLQTARVKGNPMMAQHLSRAKRNKVLTARAAAPDIAYNVKPPAVHLPKIDFGKCVPRAAIFKGRGKPSDNWVKAQQYSPGPGDYLPTPFMATA